MKKMFEFKTKTIVATAIGAALFTLLMLYVKIPTGIPETDIQTCYGVGSFFAAMFGPVAGFLIGFIGHAISDATYGAPWWSWVVSSAIALFITGLSYSKLKVDEGRFGIKDCLIFNVFQIIGNVVAWVICAPILDIVIYKEPANLVFTQGAVAALWDAISMGVIGSILLFLYSKTRSGQGTLGKE
ncbi:MAG: ECF-type riboflavin transporter substrate-binding protein [Firmicutes bacterium]|nr:ECF-type riboflavin transporter substrate-binding protein [Bacillota bacterium]